MVASSDGTILRADATDAHGYGSQIVIGRGNDIHTQYGGLKAHAIKGARAANL